LESNLQSLTDKLLSDAQLYMHIGVDRKVFNSLLAWLQPVIKPKKELASTFTIPKVIDGANENSHEPYPG